MSAGGEIPLPPPRVIWVPMIMTDAEQARVDAWPVICEHIAASEACGSLFRVRISSAHDHDLPEGFDEALLNFIRGNWHALDAGS